MKSSLFYENLQLPMYLHFLFLYYFVFFTLKAFRFLSIRITVHRIRNVKILSTVYVYSGSTFCQALNALEIDINKLILCKCLFTCITSTACRSVG